MRVLSPLVVLATAAAFAAPAAAQQPTPPPVPQIVTNGEGEATVTPDRARIHVAVETRGRTAAEAAAENSRIQTAVIARIRALGIPAERITTIGYNVQPEYSRSRDPNVDQQPRVIGYVARNTVRADVWQMNQVGPVIDGALAAGANSIGALDMYSSREDAIRRQALANAVTAARADAEAMATAAGGRLGMLLELTSGGFYRPQPMAMARGAENMVQAADTPIVAGEQTVRANVMARWQFLSNSPPR
jgi:uncharacterized protein YggE